MIWLLHIASMRWDLVERALCPNRPSLYRLIVRRYEVHGILGQAPSIDSVSETGTQLAMPSTLATDRRGAGSRRVLSRETRPPGSGEIALSQELRTVGLLWPHVLVGYQWSHTGLRPGRKTSHNRYIRSFVSQPPWNQGDPRCSFPPWPPGPRQGWTAGSDR